jgi:hypothetical protein
VLAELCTAYWFPVYALIRRKGHDPDAALDLTQGYFARLLEKPVLAAADRRRGRFRAFLLTDCVHFLANAHDRAARLKRGGGHTFVPIDSGAAEGRYGAEPAHDLTPERLFERAWAMTILSVVFDALRREYESQAKVAVFEAAVKVAVHRLRKRYKALLREQIAATVDDPSEVDDEIRALFDALG